MFKKREILLPERLMGMMRLLILNVTDHRIQLRMCIRERSKTGLPFCLSLWYCSDVAPLGLNAAQFAARYPSWGRGHLAQRVGRPNPYAYSFACSRSNFRASRFRCRPAGALVI